ncbi:MAG: BamA/TamA family outer membrane protein [bacterium]|nr:BamA/TamA family outer membrane protein [bacterium]
MSVWNRRPASSALLAAWLCCGATAAAAAAPITVRLAPGAGGDRRFAAWVREDAAWLADLAAETAVTTAAAAGDSLPGWLADPQRPPGGARRPAASLLRDRWLERGHLGCRVAPAAPDSAAVLLVAPGPRHRHGALKVGGEDFAGRDAALARWLPSPGDPVDAEAWRRAVAGLLLAAGEAGHPFAHWIVQRATVHADPPLLEVEALLVTGPAVVFGPVTSDLPGGRGAAFLAKAARLAPGSRFRESALASARRRLQLRDIYAEVGAPVVYATGDDAAVGVHWPVRLRPRPNRAAVMLGLSRTGEDGTSRLSGQVDLKLANLAGTGRGLDLLWTDDGRARSRLEIGWREPLVGGTPFDAQLSVGHEVQRSVSTRFHLDGRLSLPVSGPWGLEVGLGRDRSTYAAGAWSGTSRWRTRAGVVRRRGDPARDGWWGAVALESARRGAELRTGDGAVPGASSGEARQTMVEADLGLERWWGPRTSTAATGMFRDLRGDEAVVPLNEQYRLGGARSLRGYLEDQFHGERVAALSLELRWGHPDRSRVYTFLDLGYVRAAAADPADATRRITSVSELRGYGLGLTTSSAAGEVSLAIGFPGSVSFEDAKLHVALLQSF